jgi:O-antigen ligase
MLPLKMALVLLLLVPAVLLAIHHFFYVYLIGVFLLPVWTITLTGQAEVPGQADLRFSDACFFVAGLGWIVRGMTKQRIGVQGSYLDVCLIAFAFWIFFSICWSPTLMVGGKEFLRKLNGLFIFYLTINLVRDERDLDLAVTVWLIAGALTAFAALYETVTDILERIAGITKRTATRWGWLRATALKEGANRLGFFMNTCLMLSISRFFLASRRSRRGLLFVFIMIMVFAVISTLSRNSVMGFVVGATILFYLAGKGGKKFFLMAAVIIVVFMWISGPEYRNVFFKRIVGVLQPQETRSIEGRTQVWLAASRMIGDRPFLGAGAGGFHVLSGSYGARRLRSPHNLYIYVAAELGLIGLLLFTGVAVAFFRLAKHGFGSASSDKERFILAALFAGMTVYAFQGLVVNFTLIEREFWALLGLNVAAIKIYGQGEIQ